MEDSNDGPGDLREKDTKKKVDNRKKCDIIDYIKTLYLQPHKPLKIRLKLKYQLVIVYRVTSNAGPLF